MVPMTEQQVISSYGSEEAKRVMASKRIQGLVQPDRNNPGKDAFLMYEDKKVTKELNVVNRNRHWVARWRFWSSWFLFELFSDLQPETIFHMEFL